MSEHPATVPSAPEAHRVGVTVDLPARTVDWLVERPHKRAFIRSVWGDLAELERAGYHTGAIDALRSVLLDSPAPEGPLSRLPPRRLAGAAASPAPCGSRSAARCLSTPPSAVATTWPQHPLIITGLLAEPCSRALAGRAPKLEG